MTKIFFISDTHFGKKYSFRRDYNLNISKRNLDAIDNCEIIIKKAIEEQADFVIFLGDIYDRRNISPTFRKIVRERIFTPLANSNIQVYVIGGNHDSVRVPERGADIQELSNFPNFDVFTEFKSRIVEKNGLKMGFLFLPYIHYDVLVRMARKRGMKISTTDHNYIIAQRIMRNFISEITEKTLSGCDKRFLMGHYYLSGAKIRKTLNPAMIFGDFALNKDIIQKNLFDLVIFGHVHLKQTMWNDDRIVIPGSIDRIDMGERDSDKCYCVYDVESDHLEYRDLACRKMFKFNIELPKNEKNPTDFILNKCPSSEELGGAICNITIKYPKEKKLDIDKDFIKSHFKDCFYSYLNYSEMTETELQHLREANLDPKSLFEDFLKQRYADHEFYEDLKKIGLEIIENAIRSIDVTATGSLSIISIDMQNFNNYGMGPNKLVFEEDLYVIKGPTGTGKSSILDAITFALFKKSFRRDVGLKIDEILYDGGYVNLELSIGESKLKINRRQRSPKLKVFLDDEEIFTGLSITEKEKRLENMVGYDYESFISSFFIRQQELQIFSSLKSSERQDRLAKLFKLKIFQSADRDLKNVIDSNQNKFDNINGKIEAYSQQINDLPNIISELKEKEQKKKQLFKETQEKEESIRELREKLEKLSPVLTEFEKEKALLKEITLKKEESTSQLIQYKEEQVKYETLQKQVEKIGNLRGEIDNLVKEKDQINEKLNEKEKIQSGIAKNQELINTTKSLYNKQISTLDRQISQKKKRLEDLNVELTKDKAFEIISKEGRLNERIERLNEIEIPMAKEYKDKEKVINFNFEEKQAQDDLKIILPLKDEISKDVFIADELRVDYEVLGEDLNKIKKLKDNEISSFDQEIKTLSQEITEKGLNIDFAKNLGIIKKQITELNEKEEYRTSIESKLKSQKDYFLLIQKTKENIDGIDKKSQNHANKIKKLEIDYKKYEKMFRQFETERSEHQQYENDLSGLTATITLLKKQVTELKEIKKQISNESRELEKIKDEINKYTILRKEIFHLNGIPRFAMGKILPEISIKASEILNDLTDNRLNQIVFIPLSGNRVGFDIHVFDGEQRREASTYSGGEKTQINAAIRFAIMEKIAEIPDTSGAVFRKSDTLFIDEGDLGTLDDDSSRQLFVDKILEMNSIFKKIILITHLEDVADQFKNRIKIGRDELGKSKILN